MIRFKNQLLDAPVQISTNIDVPLRVNSNTVVLVADSGQVVAQPSLNRVR
jgi:hypothetical protein